MLGYSYISQKFLSVDFWFGLCENSHNANGKNMLVTDLQNKVKRKRVEKTKKFLESKKIKKRSKKSRSLWTAKRKTVKNI